MDAEAIRSAYACIINHALVTPSITVTFDDSTIVEGFVTQTKQDTHVFEMCKHEIMEGEQPKLWVDLMRVRQLIVHLPDGDSTFQ